MTRTPLIRPLTEPDVALLSKFLRQGKTSDQIAWHLRCLISNHYAHSVAKSESTDRRVAKIEP
jgi:hypothetical protein